MKKEKIKPNLKKNKILTIIFNTLQIISLILIIYTTSLVGKIETKWIVLGITILVMINALAIFLLDKLMKKTKIYKVIIFILVSLLLTGIQLYGSYLIYRTYNSLSSANKSSVTYETNIVVMKDSKLKKIDDLKNKTIGIVVDETSIDGYVIGLEIIDENKLEKNSKIEEYTDISSMLKDLYDNKIDAIIVSSNYTSMFTSIDAYKNIKEETKVIYKKSKKLSKKEIAKYVGEEIVNKNESSSITEPFTVLLMGIDSTADTLEKNATGNGDALMVLTFNPKTLNATIWSIPRDTYVPIACFAGQKENKITHAGWNGESCMIKTIENFTGINIDYYVKINFKGVVKMVDALGGITIDVPEEMDEVCEQDSNRNFSNQQCFHKGKMDINGEQALAFARHRKTLALGDFQRGLNQQLVVQGMLNKLKVIKSTNKALKILDTISNSIDTNFTTNQLLSFYDIAKVLFSTSSNSNNIINMQQLYLTGQGQMIYDEAMGLTLYNFIPNQDSLNQIITAMKQNLDKEKVTNKIKTMDFNIEEPFEMKMIGTDTSGGSSSYTLLPSVVGLDVTTAKAKLEALGLSVKIEEKQTTSYTSGTVISQSYPANKRIDLIKDSITLVVATNSSSSNKTEDNKQEDEITVEFNIANSEVIDTSKGETYVETDKDNIIVYEKGKDITSSASINYSYDDDNITSQTPELKTYTVTYTVTYKNFTKSFTKTVTIK